MEIELKMRLQEANAKNTFPENVLYVLAKQKGNQCALFAKTYTPRIQKDKRAEQRLVAL